MTEGAGGFVPLSPPPSSVASSTPTTDLAKPRRRPLKPGGPKESAFIRWLDEKMLHIQRRFAKRDSSLGQGSGRMKEVDEEGRMIQEVDDQASAGLARSEDWYDVPGYTSFGEAAKDLNEVANVTWVSGTPSLQIPYLISLSLLTNTIIPAFPPAPRPLFRLLGKLDYVFASMIQQRDLDTGDPLPGFSKRRGVSDTEKVRIKSLVERTRICVVDVMSRGEFEEDDMTTPTQEESAQSDIEGDLILDEPADLDVDDDAEDDNWDMMVARVYDKTLVELGDTMEGPEIGIRTEALRST